MTQKEEVTKSLDEVFKELGVQPVYSSDLSDCYAIGNMDIFVDQNGRVSIRKFDGFRRSVWTLVLPKSFNIQTVACVVREVIINEPYEFKQENKS